MGKRKNKQVSNSVPDTYIEADVVEASEEAKKCGSDIPDSALGKKLANADKKVRDKAVLVLSKWLSQQSNLDEDEHLKIWKALYYCFWMSDKPPVQNELAERIAEFVHQFPNMEQSVLFVRTFFITMEREWPGIDKLRLNKFYYLVRCFYREIFVFLARQQWNSEAIEAFNNVLIHGPLSVGSKSIDLKLHLADVFLDELANSGTFESGFDSSVFPALLQPYFALLVKGQEKSVFERVISRIFQALVGVRWLGASLAESDEVDPIQKETIRHNNRMFRHTYLEPLPLRDVCDICLDREFAAETAYLLTDKIFSFTVKKSTTESARRRFYSLLDEYTELCSSLGKPYEGDVDGVSEEEQEEVEEGSPPPSSRRGGAAHEMDQDDEEGEDQEEEEEEEEEEEQPKRKKGKGRDKAKSKSIATPQAKKKSAAAAAAAAAKASIPSGSSKKRARLAAAAAAAADTPEDASVQEGAAAAAAGGARLGVAERRALRAKLSVIAPSLAAGPPVLVKTLSPRKHAATAADFFKQETEPAAAAQARPRGAGGSKGGGGKGARGAPAGKGGAGRKGSR